MLCIALARILKCQGNFIILCSFYAIFLLFDSIHIFFYLHTSHRLCWMTMYVLESWERNGRKLIHRSLSGINAKFSQRENPCWGSLNQTVLAGHLDSLAKSFSYFNWKILWKKKIASRSCCSKCTRKCKSLELIYVYVYRKHQLL